MVRKSAARLEDETHLRWLVGRCAGRGVKTLSNVYGAPSSDIAEVTNAIRSEDGAEIIRERHKCASEAITAELRDHEQKYWKTGSGGLS